MNMRFWRKKSDFQRLKHREYFLDIPVVNLSSQNIIRMLEFKRLRRFVWMARRKLKIFVFVK